MNPSEVADEWATAEAAADSEVEVAEWATAFRPMDATTAEESFATILGNGSSWMSKKFQEPNVFFGLLKFEYCNFLR